jgi:hypothetical protein
MTCIVKYPTKKALREHIAFEPHRVEIHDPSIKGERYFTANEMNEGQSEVVTNHPKRSWFGKITKMPNGTFKVE